MTDVLELNYVDNIKVPSLTWTIQRMRDVGEGSFASRLEI